MSKTTKDQKPVVKIEPGAEKRLANILKKALNTPPKHKTKEAAVDKGKSRKS